LLVYSADFTGKFTCYRVNTFCREQLLCTPARIIAEVELWLSDIKVRSKKT